MLIKKIIIIIISYYTSYYLIIDKKHYDVNYFNINCFKEERFRCIRYLDNNLKLQYKNKCTKYENDYIGKNAKMLGVAENLANGYTFHNKNTNQINTELDEVRKVTRADIQNVAKKYLNKNQRVVVYYLPKK